MALNVETWEVTITPNTETEKRWWLWMPKLRSDNDDSECQTENTMLALNTETKLVMVALNAENWEYDSERQTENCDSERQTENWWWL